MINRRKLGEQEEVFNEKSQEMGLKKQIHYSCQTPTKLNCISVVKHKIHKPNKEVR